MNWTETNCRVNQCVTVGSFRINCLILVHGILLLASSAEGLQDPLDWFSAARDRVGMKTSTKKTEVLCLSRISSQCSLQVSGNTLQHVQRFKYRGVVFTSYGRRKKETDTRFRKRSSAWASSLCGHTMRAFKHRKAVGL